MRRLFTLIILSLISYASFAQWNDLIPNDGKQEYFQHQKALKVFDPNYLWQNDHLWDYDVHFYFIDINVSPANIYISGNTSIGATAVIQVDTFAFELIPEMTIDSFFMNDVRDTNIIHDGNNVLVPVSAIPIGNYFTAKIYYHGQPPTGGFFSGVTHDHSYTYNKDVTWTLSEPFAAKDWFPVKQVLEDKADSAWIFLTCDSAYMAGSEGLLTNVTDLGNGKKRYEWKEHHAIDYYLLSFAVADYQDYDVYAHPAGLNGDSVLIQNFIYDTPSCLQANKAGIDETAAILELYSNLYTIYPFADEKYGHCLTELSGGMEHQTMTTIGGFSFHLVSHELGHMWFGDNVTCATWSDIWINEGFATYSNYLAVEKLQGWNAGQSFIIKTQKNAMSDTSSSAGSVYIPEEQVFPGNEWRIFNGQLTYDKGASIIHMLRHEIQNDSVFFDVLDTFQIQYADSTATGEDFKNVAEAVTGTNFDYFFNQWYYGRGFPYYSYEWYYNNGKFHLSSVQTTSTPYTTLFTMLMDYKLVFADGSDTIISLWQTDNINNYVVPFEKQVIAFQVDPNNWTLEKVKSIIIGLPEKIENPVYFRLGPNPVKDKLMLYFEHPNSQTTKTISISDFEGKIFRRFKTRNDQKSLFLSGLSNGFYLIKVSDGQNTFVKKFVKL